MEFAKDLLSLSLLLGWFEYLLGIDARVGALCANINSSMIKKISIKWDDKNNLQSF